MWLRGGGLQAGADIHLPCQCGHRGDQSDHLQLGGSIYNYLRTAECLNLLVIQVTEKDKKGQGGGLPEEGEFIDVVEMGVEEVRRLKTFHN